MNATRTDTRTTFQTSPMSDGDSRRWLSCLSHEVRNPLTLIYSSLQILEKEYPCISESPLWGQTKDDIRYLIRLLKDSSAALREYQPDFTAFSVEEFFQELAISAGSLLDEQQIHFESSIIRNPSAPFGADQELLIYADRSRLKEAMMNLLINAADALSSMPDSHNRRIRLYADIRDISFLNSGHPAEGHSSENNCSDSLMLSDETGLSGKIICLHVKDNGPGIPNEYLATLFDPFVTHKSNGTGLGLSIVQNIAGLHGGTLSVETSTDTKESFTDFCLCLPVLIPGSLPQESVPQK